MCSLVSMVKSVPIVRQHWRHLEGLQIGSMQGFIKDPLEDGDAVRSDLLSVQSETQISEFCQIPQCGKGPLYFIFSWLHWYPLLLLCFA